MSENDVDDVDSLLAEIEGGAAAVATVELAVEPEDVVEETEAAETSSKPREIAWEPDTTSASSVLGVVVQTRFAKTAKKKAAALRDGYSDDLLYFLRAVYDPTVTYGITLGRLPASVDCEVEDPEPLTWSEIHELLGALSRRELVGNLAIERIVNLMKTRREADVGVLLMILGRDVRAGVAADSINKVFPDLIPSFEPMLAHVFNPKRIKKWPVAVQEKLDGFRATAFVSVEPLWESSPAEHEALVATILSGTEIEIDGEATLLTRSGKKYETVSGVAQELVREMFLAKRANTVLDGELVAGSFNETASELRTEGAEATDAVFHVFDILPVDEFTAGRSLKVYSERRADLAALFSKSKPQRVRVHPSYLASSQGEVDQYFGKIFNAGGEGIIVKQLDSVYETKRAHSWLKIKGKETTEGTIIGVAPGTGKNEELFGALVVKLDKTGVETRVSGMSDDQRRSLLKQFEMGNLVGRCVELDFHEWTPAGSVRHPRFKCLRDDKRASAAWG